MACLKLADKAKVVLIASLILAIILFTFNNVIIYRYSEDNLTKGIILNYILVVASVFWTCTIIMAWIGVVGKKRYYLFPVIAFLYFSVLPTFFGFCWTLDKAIGVFQGSNKIITTNGWDGPSGLQKRICVNWDVFIWMCAFIGTVLVIYFVFVLREFYNASASGSDTEQEPENDCTLVDKTTTVLIGGFVNALILFVSGTVALMNNNANTAGLLMILVSFFWIIGIIIASIGIRRKQRCYLFPIIAFLYVSVLPLLIGFVIFIWVIFVDRDPIVDIKDWNYSLLEYSLTTLCISLGLILGASAFLMTVYVVHAVVVLQRYYNALSMESDTAQESGNDLPLQEPPKIDTQMKTETTF